jgi:aminocarboxymuconate-semialdehyde decarboxylase
MMFTCTPACANPAHRHRPALLLRTGSVKTAVKAKSKPKPAAPPKVVRDRKGRSLRIDLHCHYQNPAIADKVASFNASQFEPSGIFANALTREVNVKQIKDRGPKLSSIEVRLKDMDRMGIDIQAVCPAPNQCIYWSEPDFGRELARMANERLAEIAATWPERFVAMGTVPLQNADMAVAELEYCVKKLGMRGVEILPNVNGKELTDPSLGLDRFFARAQALDIVIFMHPLGFTQGERLMDHYFNNVIGNPLETTVAVSHLIFDGVMERNPKLKVVLPHAGGYLAHYWARMDHAHRARPDCRVVIKKSPSSYLKKFYFDTITFDPGMLRHLIDQYGAEHVVLGTDYPYDMGMETPVKFIESVSRLSRADRDKIMGGNAARLLKIKL